MRFPTVKASDLDGRHYDVPDGLPGHPRIIMVAFQRWHTMLLAGWLPEIERLAEETEGLTAWEMPTLSTRYRPARAFIDGGMRAGIPDSETRAMTLTAYTDLRRFMRALEIPSTETVHVLLLDAGGEVVWRASGEADESKVRSLAAAVRVVSETPA